MKRTKDELAAMESVAGVMMAVVGLLVAAVRKLGGKFSHVRRLTTPGGAKTMEQIAALIVGVGKPEAQAPAPSWWRAIFTALIRACGFTYQNPNITSENFSCENAEPGQVEIVSIKKRLVELSRTWLRTDEVLAYLAELGYRPATIWELLLWWLSNPTKHSNCFVVALGQLWRGNAPYVHGYSSYRCLSLYSAGYGWDASCEFAAVRK